MEVVSFKLYHRELIFDDLEPCFTTGVGETEWDWLGVRRGVCVGGGWVAGGTGVGEGQTDRDRQTETDRERVALKICCFSTVLQVTAVEVKPIC